MNRHNKPPRKKAAKVDERLLGLLLQVLEALAKYEPETAARVRAKIMPVDPDDGLDNLEIENADDEGDA
jgi:hypothetical protein